MKGEGRSEPCGDSNDAMMGPLQGMLQLHSKNIVHRDLKSANLLVDKHWRVKVQTVPSPVWLHTFVMQLRRLLHRLQLAQNLPRYGT